MANYKKLNNHIFKIHHPSCYWCPPRRLKYKNGVIVNCRMPRLGVSYRVTVRLHCGLGLSLWPSGIGFGSRLGRVSSLWEGRWPSGRANVSEPGGPGFDSSSRQPQVVAHQHWASWITAQYSLVGALLCLASNHGIACALRLGPIQSVTDFWGWQMSSS